MKIKLTDQNGRQLEIEDKVNLMPHRHDTFFYRTKDKEVWKRILIFVIWKKSIQEIRKATLGCC